MKKHKRLLNEIIELLKSGYSEDYILDHVQKQIQDPNSLEYPKELLALANSMIEEEFATKSRDVWTLHISRYNAEVNRLLNTPELDPNEIGKSISHEQWQASRDKKIKNYNSALDVMNQQETLLQLINKTTVIEINEEVTGSIHKPKYNLDVLTFEEQVELMNLLDKAKEGKMENISVTAVMTEHPAASETSLQPREEPINIQQIKHEQILPETNTIGITDPFAHLKETTHHNAKKILLQLLNK